MVIFVFVACLTVLDVVFVVDASGSIVERDPNGWNLVKGFIGQVIRRLAISRDEVRVGLVVYSNTAARLGPGGSAVDGAWGLLTYTSEGDLLAAVDRVPYIQGTTNTQDGLFVAASQIFQPPGDRPGVTNLAIVITDGASNEGVAQLPARAAALRAVSTVIAVGVTDAVNVQELELIASEDASGTDLIIFADDFDVLAEQLQSLLDTTCGAVTAAPPTPAPATPAPPRPGLPGKILQRGACLLMPLSFGIYLSLNSFEYNKPGLTTSSSCHLELVCASLECDCVNLTEWYQLQHLVMSCTYS